MLFLGARLDCAHCHAHPTENWGQDDALGMAAFFSKVAIKATQEWKEEIVFFNQHGGVYHPQRREYVNPKFLGGEAVEMPRDQDPRPKFAEWLTAPGNPLFAKVMANRVWYWLLGRGIVHEPDDFRSTNPPSNPELLDYLTQEFVGHKFDVKHVFRLILISYGSRFAPKQKADLGQATWLDIPYTRGGGTWNPISLLAAGLFHHTGLFLTFPDNERIRLCPGVFTPKKARALLRLISQTVGSVPDYAINAIDLSASEPEWTTTTWRSDTTVSIVLQR